MIQTFSSNTLRNFLAFILQMSLFSIVYICLQSTGPSRLRKFHNVEEICLSFPSGKPEMGQFVPAEPEMDQHTEQNKQLYFPLHLKVVAEVNSQDSQLVLFNFLFCEAVAALNFCDLKTTPDFHCTPFLRLNS